MLQLELDVTLATCASLSDAQWAAASRLTDLTSSTGKGHRDGQSGIVGNLPVNGLTPPAAEAAAGGRRGCD